MTATPLLTRVKLPGPDVGGNRTRLCSFPPAAEVTAHPGPTELRLLEPALCRLPNTYEALAQCGDAKMTGTVLEKKRLTGWQAAVLGSFGGLTESR